ncbi:hypothetical protein [Ectopseudomonas oleovorans]|jgi:hypothetical protein|uniref:hypothetical protein n=1 Tax=Ectopseudomonas oleovorans TaxID=301 RepID=UPI00142DED52|nr:hypothetical protein [Pseudomonas indoloxydans]
MGQRDASQIDNIQHLTHCDEDGCERCENLMYFFQACDVCGTWGHNDAGPCSCSTRLDLADQLRLVIPEECPHMIVFDDADRQPLMFAGAGSRPAALKTFEMISQSWNAHLFVRIARNSRDDRHPIAAVEQTATAELVDALKTCEAWFSKHSPTAPLIAGLGVAEHPMLTLIRNALSSQGGVSA